MFKCSPFFSKDGLRHLTDPSFQTMSSAGPIRTTTRRANIAVKPGGEPAHKKRWSSPTLVLSRSRAAIANVSPLVWCLFDHVWLSRNFFAVLACNQVPGDEFSSTVRAHLFVVRKLQTQTARCSVDYCADKRLRSVFISHEVDALRLYY